ncbi:MAG: hypothetical protein ABN484_07790, partial [Nocardioides kribbensis]
SAGVSALGALLSVQVADKVASGLAAIGVSGGSETESHSIPDLDTLPGPVREIFQSAFGESFGHLFLVATPFAVLALVCVLFIEEVPLRTTNDLVPDTAPGADEGSDLLEASTRRAAGAATGADTTPGSLVEREQPTTLRS